MHSYSIDTKERTRVIQIITIVSIMISAVLAELLSTKNIDLPDYLDFTSFSVIFGILYFSFDKFLWKWKLFTVIGLVKIPIIAGEWEGQYVSSYCDKDGNKFEGVATLKIKQTWTEICIYSTQKNSRSESQIAGLFINGDGIIKLKYQYQNEAKNTSDDTMNSHMGFNELVFDNKMNTLEGNYFTDRNRKTYGYLKYRKIGAE